MPSPREQRVSPPSPASPSPLSAACRNPVTVLTTLLAVVVVANLVVMASFTRTINRKLEEAVELSKPQEATLTVITAAACPQCRPQDAVIGSIKAQNVDILAERTVVSGSSEADALIGTYAVGKLPAVILESETRIKTPVRRAMEKDGRAVGEKAFVWEQDTPPYFDLAENRTAGLVDAVYLTDRRCAGCFDPMQILQPMLRRFGVQIASSKTVDVSDAEGKDLTERYAITAVPTVILSKDASAYPALFSSWSGIGTTEADGILVFRSVSAVRAPYMDLTSGSVVEPPSPAQ